MPLKNFAALGEALAQDSSLAVIYVDREGKVRSWSAGAEALFGHEATDALGRDAEIIIPQVHRDGPHAGLPRAVRSDWRGSGGWDPIEPMHCSGELVAAEVFLAPVKSAEGEMSGVLALFRRAVAI